MEWFEDKLSYSGSACAEFEDPDLVAKGQATATLDRYGHCRIEFSVESVDRSAPSDEPPEVEALTVSGTRCAALTIDTQEGEFACHGRIRAIGFPVEGGTMTIIPILSEFTVAKAELDGRYWVLPLLNFVSGARQSDAGIERHALRVAPTAHKAKRGRVPNWLPQGTLIRFEYSGRPGFIERLPDYEARVSSLKEGRQRATITSLMIGELVSDDVTISSVGDWPVLDALLILGLASGAEVGAPWIEFRALDGALVRRIHSGFHRPDYGLGHPAIYEEVSGATGTLLTCALGSGTLGDRHFRVVLKHTVRANSHEATPSDCLRSTFIALEGLITLANLDHDLSLSPSCERRAKRFLESGEDALKLLALDTSSCTDADGPLLRRLAARVRNQYPISPAFGECVTKLIRASGFHDVELMDTYYSQHPGPDGAKQWSRVVSKMRAIAMHVGYFDFGTLSEFDQILVSMNHLRDVLVRIVLRRLGYEGTYYTPTNSWVNRMDLDWVESATDPKRLGYDV